MDCLTGYTDTLKDHFSWNAAHLYYHTVNVLKFLTLYSILFWPNVCFSHRSFLKYFVEWQIV